MLFRSGRCVLALATGRRPQQFSLPLRAWPSPAGGAALGLGAGSAAGRMGVRGIPSCWRAPRRRWLILSLEPRRRLSRWRRVYSASGGLEALKAGSCWRCSGPDDLGPTSLPVSMAAGVLCRAAPASATQQLRSFQLAWSPDVPTTMATVARICVPPVLACRRCQSPSPHRLMACFAPALPCMLQSPRFCQIQCS